MNERLLEKFKKIPEQIKGLSTHGLGKAIDDAQYIADDHAQVVTNYEYQADKLEAERRQLEAELNNMGVKQISPEGLQLRRKIREVKRQAEKYRDLAEEYRDLEFYERTRASEAIIERQEREPRYEQPERTADQVEQDISREAQRLSQTTFGKITKLNDKLAKTTDPQEREKLEKEVTEYRGIWQKECDAKVPGYKPSPETQKAAEPALSAAEKDVVDRESGIQQNLDKKSLKEIQEIGRDCFGNLRDVGCQIKTEADPVQKASLEEERATLSENWQEVKQEVFEALETEQGPDRIHEPDRDPEPTV